MGFWSGFAQGWEAESERIERRKLFQQEQNERRIATLGELLTKFVRGGALGAAGRGSDDATPASADHIGQLIIRAGGTPDMVGELNAQGGVGALSAAWEAVQKVRESGQPVTPELFTQIQESIVVTAREGGDYDVDGIIDQMYGPDWRSNLDPEQNMILEMQIQAAQGSQTPEVTSTFIPPEPIRPEEVKNTVDLMNSTLMARLADRKASFDAQSVDAALPENERSAAATEAAKLDAMMKQVEAGNVIAAANTYGQDIIGPILQNNPILAKQPALLGPWAPIAERYTQGQQQPAQESGVLTFTSNEEAEAAIRAGRVPYGATFFVNGQSYQNDLK